MFGNLEIWTARLSPCVDIYKQHRAFNSSKSSIKKTFAAISTATIFFLFAISASLLGGNATAKGAFPLVSPDSKLVIVGQGGFLRRILVNCTGKKVPMIYYENRYKPKKGVYPIYVGNTKMARELLAEDIKKLDIEGYIILVQPDKIIIYGGAPKTDTGSPSVWAQAEFGRRFFNSDCYFPGPLGAVYPKCDKLSIKPCKIVENPAIKHRHWSGYSGQPVHGAWRIRSSGGGGRFHFHHNLYNIIDPIKYKDHPEYFPVPNRKYLKSPRYKGMKPGDRYVPDKAHRASYWQPCPSNPEVTKLVVDTILEYYKKNPDKEAYSLGVNDSNGFCYCDKCLKVFPPGVDPESSVAAAYRFYKFYNEIADRVVAKHPQARLGFLFYGAMIDWMPKKLNPALMPYITQNMSDCFDKSYRDRNYKTISDLSAGGPHIGMYEYLFGWGYLIPRIYTSNMAEGLRFFNKLNGDGFYAEAAPNWGLDGPKLWILEKLLWNPKLDEKKLLTQWCDALFGKAAPAMRKYFQFLESAWMNQKPSNNRRGGYRLMGPQYKKEQFTEIFTPEVCEKAWKILEKAEKAAKSEITKKRIAFFKNTFGITRLASNRYQSATTLDKLFKKKKAVPVTRCLEILEAWAKFPEIQVYADKLKKEAPLSLYEFCVEKFTKKRGSFSSWDSEPRSILRVVAMIKKQALAPDKTGKKPATASEYKSRVERILQTAADKVPGGAGKVKRSVALIRKLADSAIDILPLSTPLKIDGTIEPAWGEPTYSGNLYRYPKLSLPVTQKTEFWIRQSGETLFVAFRCQQDPGTVLNNLPGHDKVDLKLKHIISMGGLCPYLWRVDSVGISVANRVIAIVTSANGTLDAVATSRGPSIKLIETLKSAVKRGKNGWSAEFTLDLSGRNKVYLKGNPIKFNFFRVRKHVRSAWMPATPNRWGVFPGSYGYMFVPQIKD